MAQALAERVATEAGADDGARVAFAVWLTLSRAPDADELTVCRTLLSEHEQRHLERQGMTAKDAHAAALVDLCRMLLNVNEFVYVD